MSHVGHTEHQLCAARRRRIALNCHAASPTRHTDPRSVTDVTSDRRHSLGKLGEELAAGHLVKRGFEIVERNYRTRWGEVDIIAYDGRTLAFCEVKARRLPGRAGNPLDGVRTLKRAQVRKMAGRWLIERTDRPYADVVRFDAIGVTFDPAGELISIEHLEGAF
jgi:putative endonuclease